MVTIKEYKNALSQLKTLNKQQKQQEVIIEGEKKAVEDKYWELERKLREKRDKLASNKHKEVNGMDSKLLKYENKMSVKKQIYNDVCNNVEDIFKMFDILISENKEPTVFDEFPSKEGKCLGLLKVLHDDKYKRVFVYLESNNKPKNNVTLKIKIESLFRYHFDAVNISTMEIRYASTVDELTEWFQRNENDLRWKWGWQEIIYFTNIMEEQFCLEKLYGDVQELWGKKGWRRVYWNYKKDYYENCYSSGTETEEYRDVLEQLRILK